MILAAFILLLLVHGLVSRRLERTVITAPIIFTLAGILLQPVFSTFQQNAVHKTDTFLHLAEIGFRDIAKHSIEFTEEWGQLLNYSVFFLFGMISCRDFPQLGPACLVYAALSLTVVRMLPVAVALAGGGLSRTSVLFMGWCGPRGLASIVLGLVYLENELHLPGENTIRLAVIATVLLSIFAHGLSAAPAINWHARHLENS